MRLLPGSIINCRPIGMLAMTDEGGDDEKLVVVPSNKVSPMYRDVETVRALPALIRDQIAHFFQHYKDLEKGKSVKIAGWADPEETAEIIRTAIKRFNETY